MGHFLKLTTMLVAGAMLSACSDSDDPVTGDPADQPVDAEFEVSIINLTNAQPMSPAAIMLHRAGFNSFIDGETATPALELLAEGGNNADVLSEAQAAVQHIATGSTTGPIGPQQRSSAVNLSVPESDLADMRLSVISMLVHTNDAFTGSNAINVSNMAVGETQSFTGPTWDSCTEANSETAATIPGPAFNGEGFNAIRDDNLDLVRFHGGAVTSASATFGLPTSDLDETHRFLNPSSRIIITRTQ